MLKALDLAYFKLNEFIRKLDNPVGPNQGGDDISQLCSSLREISDLLNFGKNYVHQLENIVEITGIGVWDWYINTGEVTLNERWAGIIGYTLHELQPVSIKTLEKFVHPDDLANSRKILEAHWKNPGTVYTCESRMRHKDGNWVWVFDTGKTIDWDENGKPIRMIGTHVDISEYKNKLSELSQEKESLKSSYISLQRDSLRDPLTNVFNRRYYDQRISTEIAYAKRTNHPLSLIIVDIDCFKQYNDNYGHKAGDEVIKKIAEAINKPLNRNIDMVARYGGEEFIVMLPQTELQGALKIADEIQKTLEAEHIVHRYSKVKPFVTVSIGIATTSGDLFNEHTLFNAADEALYEAKACGRNQIKSYDTRVEDL